MNKSRIEWCDHTWNPITGCLNGCEYCYARRMTLRFNGDIRINKMAINDYTVDLPADGQDACLYILEEPMVNSTYKKLVYPFGFEPTLHKYRLKNLDALKMGNNIFVGAMADVFGSWVPIEWIDMIIAVCVEKPQHNYLFLTKNPGGYSRAGVPMLENMFYGVTVTREKELVEMITGLPQFGKTYVSIEPLLEDIHPERYKEYFKFLDWIIIGAETGRNTKKMVPQFEWIKSIVLVADLFGIPVFMKDSLIEIVSDANMRREFPEQLNQRNISEKMKDKLFGLCNVCKKKIQKNKMFTLAARKQRGKQPQQIGFICIDCANQFELKYGLKFSKLEEKDEKEKL